MITIADFKEDNALECVLLYYEKPRTVLYKKTDYFHTYSEHERFLHKLRGMSADVKVKHVRRRQREGSIHYSCLFYGVDDEYNVATKHGIWWMDDEMRRVSTSSEWPDLTSPAKMVQDFMDRK